MVKVLVHLLGQESLGKLRSTLPLPFRVILIHVILLDVWPILNGTNNGAVCLLIQLNQNHA